MIARLGTLGQEHPVTGVTIWRGCAVVHLAGELDLHNAPLLHRTLIELIDGGCRRVVVDATGLNFCDSVGLGVLIDAFKSMHAFSGELRLAAPDRNVRATLRMTGLIDVLGVRDTLQEVLDEFSD
ncbi:MULTISPECIES: STAS domain-containing protein [unclassified Embleya]|uniref:STAS domain-containing protein n=1 Tax=unclassified Embleya TaxID=2699296 RepID=UPI0034017E90